jgi:hypothetical protein
MGHMAHTHTHIYKRVCFSHWFLYCTYYFQQNGGDSKAHVESVITTGSPVMLRNLDVPRLWNGTRLVKHRCHILIVQEGRMYLFPNYQQFPIMYHFNFSDCSFYWTSHLESPWTQHTGSRLELQIFYLRLFVVSWTTICICSVLPKQKCRPHIYTSPKDIQII